MKEKMSANNNISRSVYLLLFFFGFAVYRASCRLTRVSVQMPCFTQKPRQKRARKSDLSSMTLPLRYAITDGDKNCIGVVCPPFMSFACHLSCAVRLNMRVNSWSHEGLMQRNPSGRTVQAVLQTTLLRFCVLLYCSKALCGAFPVLRSQLSRFLRVTMYLMLELITYAP